MVSYEPPDVAKLIAPSGIAPPMSMFRQEEANCYKMLVDEPNCKKKLFKD